MRPLKLSLSGFTCFKEPTEINFADLELFAIVGQTGSGKSSILDGITYALFGETSRLGAKGLEALVSLGGSSMYAVLEFEASDGAVYKVSRVWSRKASEKALRFERLEGSRWMTAAEGVKIKEMEAAIVGVVGLDFAGFTRSIVLPQGEFDRFLRGNATERRELLKSLLGLERIEAMMRRAGEIAREAKGRLEGIAALLADAAQVTPEFIEAQRDRLEETVGALREASVALERQRGVVGEAREVVKLSSDLETVGRERVSWEARGDEASRARQRVAAARRVAAVIPVLNSLERTEKVALAARADVTRREAQLGVIQAQREAALERQQAAAQAALETVDLDVQITALNVVKPKLERLRALGGSLEEADARFAWDEARYASLEELRNQLGLLRKLEKDEREVKAQFRTANTEVTTLQGQLEAGEGQLGALKLEGTGLSDTVKAVQAALEAARRENLVAQVVTGLEIGDPCPVCGEALTAIPDAGESRVPALETELETVTTRLNDLRAQFRASQETNRLNTANLEKLRAQSAQLETRLDGVRGELETLRGAFQRAVGDVEDPVSAVQEARAGLLAGLAAEIVTQTGGADVEGQIVALAKRKRQLEDAQRNAEKALSESQVALGAAQSALEGAMSLRAERDSELQDLQTELEAALRTADCATPQAARDAALPESEIQRLEALEREFTERLTLIRERELNLRETLAGRNVSAAQLEAMERQGRDLETQVRELTQTQGRLEQSVQDAATRLREKNRMVAEAATLEKRFDVYQALSNDLKGNAFQDYLLSQVQRDLLARASHVMREVTRDRYILTLEDGEFSVRDAWNGMEPRSVRTLSGGESFIASLSLALALSDYLAGSKALGALFLDEGFGTLDSDALDAVASVLEALNTRGRTVGVITHVASLAERLPNRLMVEKGQSSSRAYWTE